MISSCVVCQLQASGRVRGCPHIVESARTQVDPGGCVNLGRDLSCGPGARSQCRHVTGAICVDLKNIVGRHRYCVRANKTTGHLGRADVVNVVGLIREAVDRPSIWDGEYRDLLWIAVDFDLDLVRGRGDQVRSGEARRYRGRCAPHRRRLGHGPIGRRGRGLHPRLLWV